MTTLDKEKRLLLIRDSLVFETFTNAIITLRDEGLLPHGDNIVYEQNCPDCQLKTLWEISFSYTQQNKIESNCCLTCIAIGDKDFTTLLRGEWRENGIR